MPVKYLVSMYIIFAGKYYIHYICREIMPYVVYMPVPCYIKQEHPLPEFGLISYTNMYT